MASAGTVTLQLDADSVRLLRELQKSQRATASTASKMRKSMTNAFSAIRTVVLSAGTAMAAFGAFRGFARIAGEIDNIGKLVDRLGGSTEAFSELQFVAERSGLAFNTLTMGLQRMQRRVAEAAAGFGEAKDALAELGLNAEALNKLTIDKQFEAVAEAMSKVTVEGDRTRLLMKVFDSEGVALGQAMTEGAEGIRELRNEAVRLNYSLSTEQVKAATDAKDAMTSLNAAADGLSRTLTVKLAPSIARVLDGWNNLITSNRQAEISRRMDILRKDLEFYGHDPKMVKVITDEFGELAKELELLKNPVRDAADGFEELQEIIVTVAKRTDDYGKDLDAFSNQFATAAMRADALRRQLQRFDQDLSPETIAKINEEITEILQGGIEEINTGPILRMKKVTKAATEEMSEYAKEAARNMQDAFADFLFDPFQDGLDGMLKSFLDTIRRMLANKLAASIFDGLGISSVFGGPRAMGGPVTAGTPYLVGEKGPELFVPGSSGGIVANDKLGGGANITYNIDARGADEAAVIARMVPLLERTVQVTKAEIRKDMNEGPPMTTYAYPALSRAPSSMVVQYVSNTDVYRSPITGAIQSVDRGGEHLLATLTYNDLKTVDRALLIAFLAKMNGHQHRVTLPFLAVDNQGAFGGTPLVAGASQTGLSVDIDGCSNTITDWIKAGDIFSLNGEMKIATADADTNGSGETTLAFSPRLRSSPPDNEPIETTTPVGTFLLADPVQSWNYRPGSFSDFVIQFVEDIAA